MPRAHVVNESAVHRSPRVMQLEGLFDLPPAERAALSWSVDLPLDDAPWNIGLIVGPSGAGKSTIANALFGPAVVCGFDWPLDRALIDAFPPSMTVKQIAELLSTVGLASVPTWLRPFATLSTGEQFRATVARAIAETETKASGGCESPGAPAKTFETDSSNAPGDSHPPLAQKANPLLVIDEFTSVVDRTVAKIGSAAVAKTVRARGLRFVAVTCHYDVIDWLCPDWTFEPASNDFQWRRLQRRPPIALEIRRTTARTWRLFHRHHYLSAELSPSARCFLGSVDGAPAVFTAVLAFPHPTRPGWREHRTVCLPDFQGVGIGNAFSAFVASLFKATGRPYRSVTGSPAMIHHRAKSPLWKMTRPPSQTGRSQLRRLARTTASNRLTASFEYTGPARPHEAALFGVLP